MSVKKITTKKFFGIIVSLAGALFLFFNNTLYEQVDKKSLVISSPTIYSAGQEKNTTPTTHQNALENQDKTIQYFLVTRVIDGDTIELENGEKVRYIGINTPEIHHPKKSVECFGKEAAKKNEELVLGKKVRLEKDVSETDKYKRLLRYVYLEDGIMVNRQLIQDGYACLDTFPPDVKFSVEFKTAMQEAREQKKGLWAMCN
jgi:micrococcal nuclease